jgi:hypothetical protein
MSAAGPKDNKSGKEQHNTKLIYQQFKNLSEKRPPSPASVLPVVGGHTRNMTLASRLISKVAVSCQASSFH